MPRRILGSWRFSAALALVVGAFPACSIDDRRVVAAEDPSALDAASEGDFLDKGEGLDADTCSIAMFSDYVAEGGEAPPRVPSSIAVPQDVVWMGSWSIEGFDNFLCAPAVSDAGRAARAWAWESRYSKEYCHTTYFDNGLNQLDISVGSDTITFDRVAQAVPEGEAGTVDDRSLWSLYKLAPPVVEAYSDLAFVQVVDVRADPAPEEPCSTLQSPFIVFRATFHFYRNAKKN